ncbi:hypothetical protein [Labrys wisconsinensis]|uniref:Uncharacterized protein n=1 Tax=Labrys wisconsinensis TaxID=425677 RepID=A0ABU0JDP2_9HYPH|nr:hypothetical protein [Labrys wisconsinensis]MDQ0472399.1 hypothetical protein [Labrys wisconsinensis]
MSDGPSEFDLSAAWIRRAQGDLKAFLEAFAVRMESALPDHVVVERRRDGFFSSTRHVTGVTVRTDGDVFILGMAGARLVARRQKLVRGVAVKTEVLGMPEWLVALDREVKLLAEQAGAAQSALHGLLMS